MHKSIAGTAFVNAVATVAYIALVGTFFAYVPQMLGSVQEPNALIPIMMLTMFVVSAAITGFLVLGKPIMWYLDGKKKESVNLFAATIGYLTLFAVIAFLILWRSQM